MTDTQSSSGVSQSEIDEAVDAFLYTQTWVESAQAAGIYLETLLLPQARAVLADLLAQNQDQEQVAQQIQFRMDLLERVRSEGVQAAYADLLTPEYMNWMIREMQTLQDKRDLARRVALARSAALLADAFGEKKLRAGIQVFLSALLMDSSYGSQVEFQEEAIHHLVEALEILTPEIDPERYALACRRLAALYSIRAAGSPADNQERALEQYHNLLQVYRRENDPAEWARASHNTGEIYRQRINGEEEDNIDQAILHFGNALEVFTEEAYPVDFGLAENSLGAVYITREKGGRSENVEEGIRRLKRALRVRPRDRYPDYWAKTHMNLGSAYLGRVQGRRVDNLKQAVEHMQLALEVFTPQNASPWWAPMAAQLSQAYLDLYETGADDALDQAILLARQVLDQKPATRNARALSIAHSSLGRGLLARGGDQDARLAGEHLRSAIEILSGFPRDREWARLQSDLASAALKQEAGDPDENRAVALACYQACFEVYTRDRYPRDWARTHLGMASTYLVMDPEKQVEAMDLAIDHFLKALEVYTRDTDPQLWATIQVSLGSAYSDRPIGDPLENTEQAIQAYERGVAVIDPAGDLDQWLRARKALASLYEKRRTGERGENFAQAIAQMDAILSALPREKDPQEWARAHREAGILYFERRAGQREQDLERALEHLEQSLLVYTREAFPQDWAIALHNLGNVYSARLRGDRAANQEKAIRCFEQSLEIDTRESQPEDWALSLNSLAGTLRERITGDPADNLERAIHYFELALEVFTREKHPDDWAMTLHNLAIAYMARPRGSRALNIERAVEFFNASLEFRRLDNEPVFYAMTQQNLGTATMERKYGVRKENLQRAIQHYQEALRIYTREANPFDWAALQFQSGSVYADLARQDGDPPGEDDAGEQAEAYYRESLEIYTFETYPERWAVVQNSLGSLYMSRAVRGEPAAFAPAQSAFERALGVFTLEANPANHHLALSNLGSLYFNTGRWTEALEILERAVQVSEQIQSASFTELGKTTQIEKSTDHYFRAAYCALKMERYGEGLVWFERGKTQIMNDFLARENADLSALGEGERQNLLEARQALRALEWEMRLPLDTPGRRDDATVGREIQQAQAHLAGQVRKIREAHPEFMSAAMSEEEILAQIPGGGGLAAFFYTSQGSAAFVLPSGTRRVEKEHILMLDGLSLAALDDLINGSDARPGWINSYLDWKEGGSLQEWMADLQSITGRLWEALVGPLWQRLAELRVVPGAPLVLIPQGALSLLPLHAAWREENGKPRYFCDDYSLSYAPSAYALSVCRERAARRQDEPPSILAVIDPTGDLPFTHQEGELVAACFPAEKRQVLSGKDASQAAVFQAVRGRTCLHFACHGYYDWFEVMNSGLLLAANPSGPAVPSTGKDPLTLAEILSPEFRLDAARLIALSACETGMSEYLRTPDEYIGLPAAFLQAGAPAVISTLWAVNDVSSALLMGRFYQGYLLEKRELPTALQEAQQWLRTSPAKELGLEEYYRQVYLASKGTNRNALMAMRFYREHPETRPFEHPFYWAAFEMTGV